MVFDSIVLASIAVELNSVLMNGRVNDIYQPKPLDIVITVRNNAANYNLLISADAVNPRMYITSIKQPNPMVPPNFCMLLRKYLKGARFRGAEQNNLERILNLRFEAYDGERFTLAAEIMGKHSNIVLINDLNKIIGVIKPIGRSKNRFREVLVGRKYILPPEQSKANPFVTSNIEFDEMFEETFDTDEAIDSNVISSWIVRTFAGISPFAAKEIVYRAENDPKRIGDEFAIMMHDIMSSNYSPVIISDDEGSTIGFYPFQSAQYSESNQFQRSSISVAADVFYSSSIPKAAISLHKDTLRAQIMKEIDSRIRTIAFIEDSIKECDNANRYKELGEIILSQTNSIVQGEDKATLIDYYDPNGGNIEVKLNPMLSPAENAESYYRKYQKAISGAEALNERLISTKTELSILQNGIIKLDESDDEKSIEKIEEKIRNKGIVFTKQEAIITEKKRNEFEGFKIVKQQFGNYEVLVGMNSQANDHLITRVAKPNDIWVHVKASASAHVIIRTNGKPESVSRNVLEFAADLAVKNSDSKHSSLVPVDYTLRKYVRKPKGAPSGKVIYNNEKTIYITPA